MEYNEAAMEMIQTWQSPDEVEEALLMLARKEKIMGFGQQSTGNQTSNVIIKQWAEKLAYSVGDTVLYPVSVRCEEVMARSACSATQTSFMHPLPFHGHPDQTFYPDICYVQTHCQAAHVKEQRANNRIIRPSADYIGRSHLNGSTSATAERQRIPLFRAAGLQAHQKLAYWHTHEAARAR